MNEELYAQIKADLAANETEHKSFRRRLDDHDAALKKQNEILVVMERQAGAIERMTEAVGNVENKVSSIDNRLAVIEKEPGDKWKKVTWEILKYLVIAAVGFGASFLFGGLGG